MRTASFQLAALVFALSCSNAADPPGDASSGGAGAVASQAGGTGGSGGAAGSASTGQGGSLQAGTAGQAGSTSGTAGRAGGSAGQNQAGGSGAGGGAGGSAGSAGAAGSCDPSLSAQNRETVATAIDLLFVEKDADAAIEQYWADPYLQHNPIAESGVDTFAGFMVPLVSSQGFSYERLRTFGECDLVVVQGEYSGTGVIFDMFRVADGKIMEHWDSDSGQASGTDGTSDEPNTGPTSENRALVLGFLEQALIDGDHEGATEVLSPAYVEHRSTGASGPDAFFEYVGDGNISYSTVHHVIADGAFVFTLSEGELNGVAYGFYDLFRVDAGLIVEHWDSRRSVPSSTASGLGIF